MGRIAINVGMRPMMNSVHKKTQFTAEYKKRNKGKKIFFVLLVNLCLWFAIAFDR
jgi:hypothetical protein